MKRRMNILLGYPNMSVAKNQHKYGSTKTYKGTNNYHKQAATRVQMDKRSPKFSVNIIDCVQTKPETQEPKNYKIVNSDFREKTEKYKGKKSNYFKQRKRSTKRDFKEDIGSRLARTHIGDIPPKSDLQRMADAEWIKSVDHDLTPQEKSVLLSINDQSERNREYSSILSSKMLSNGGNQERLAGQPLRKSKFNLKEQSPCKGFDEILLEKVSNLNLPEKRHKIDEDTEQRVTFHNKGRELGIRKDALETIKSIRQKGGEACEKRLAQKSSKRTPSKIIENSPSTSHFNDEDDLKVKFEETLVLKKPIESFERVLNDNYVSTQETEKPLEVITKVQGHQRDITVPLITEIQPKEVAFKATPVLHSISQPELSQASPAPTSESINREIIEQVKDTNKGLKRTPAKVYNKPIYSSPLKIMGQESNPGSEFKTPLPKRSRSVSKSVSPPSSSKSVLTTFAFRNYDQLQKKEYDEILLPKNFQLILDFFTELDNAINNCKRRGKLPIFSNLKQYVQQATSRTFEIENFQRVFFCSPDLYYYTWYQPDKNSDVELRIEIPENIEEILKSIESKASTIKMIKEPLLEPMPNFTLNKRKKLVRARLMQYIESIHFQFLKSINQVSYDFLKNRAWHPDFLSEKGANIPTKKLEDMPKSKRSETISEFLKSNNIKNNLTKKNGDTLSHSASAGAIVSNHSTSASSIMLHSNKRSPAKIINSDKFSPNFFKRIETKEKMIEIEKANIKYQTAKESTQRKIELMLKIASAVKNVFYTSGGKVNTLFLRNVLKILNDTQRGNFYEKSELISTLKEISQIVPEWIKLEDHKMGFLVKI